jgi:multisubunit Na+/H+ antiporter MnhG subunit
MSSTNSGAAAAQSVATVAPKTDTWGIILSILGIILVSVALGLQFSVLDHGSSNQLTIDAEVKKSIWGVLTGVILFVLGFVLWIWFSTFKNKYLVLFLFSLFSYMVANTALMFSLYQVQLTKI